MKNRNFIKNSILLLLPAALGLGVLLGVNKKPVEKVEGYSTSTLPTTIDLNDTSAANIRQYYSSLNGKSESERKGTNLLKNLKTILKKDQKYYSYDSGNAIWQIYEIADRDWSKSPASSTTYGTYNSSTNKITNYTYGTSKSSSKNNPYIHALYLNRNVTNQTTAWDDHQQTQWGINREHVWPKAEGFETSGAGGARGDPMHLMAGNGYANNIHSNYYYGYVDTSTSYTNCGSKYSNLSGNLLGKSKTLTGTTTNVFEPQDSDKGDIARAIFYMVARYNYYGGSGSDSDSIDSDNPNLALTQSLSDWSNTGYASSTSRQGFMGIMTDLLAWHHADPVDQYEIHRNNILYTNYTNNRNPFIDFPEWADFIWGSVNYTGSKYISHSTTPTGSAMPSTDTINGYNSGSGGGETIAVAGVTLNTNSTSVEVGSDTTLTPTISPSDATNQGVSWSTSNANVATVSGGIVTGVSKGSATITVTTNDGGETAQCVVTVTASQSQPTDGTISFSRSESANTCTDGYSLTAVSGSAKAEYYQDKNASEGLDLDLKKSSGTIWTTSPTTLSLKVKVGGGTTKDPLANNVIAYFLDSSGNVIISSATTVTTKVETTTGQEYTVSMPSTNNVAGIRIHHDKDADYNVRIYSFSLTYGTPSGKTLSSISLDISDAVTEFYVNDEFDYGGLSVIAHYSDSSEEPVTGYEVVSPDLSSIGSKKVDVTYTENEVETSASYNVTVKYPGSSATSQMIVSNDASSHYRDGAIYLTGTSSLGSAECSAFTVTQSRTSGYSIKYDADQIRVYGGHTFAVTPKEGYVLSSIILYANTSGYASYIGAATNATKNIVDDVVTLSPVDGTTTVSFYNTSASWINYMIVNFEENHLSWDAPAINVYSGATLTAEDVDSWSVNDGSTTYTSSQLSVKLGGETISIPHTWSVSDDGKALKAVHNDVTTAESDSVMVTQSVNSIINSYEDTYDYEFTSAVYSSAGSQTLNDHVWTQSGTLKTGTGHWGYDTTKGHQFGKAASPYTSLTLSCSDFTGIINSVTVSTSGAKSVAATVKVSVNGIDYGIAKSITATNTGYTFDLGGQSGTILISWTQTSEKALYVKEIVVDSLVNGNIANNVNHIAAQRAVVKFANAFNSAMSETNYCTTNLDSAWSACSDAYDVFVSESSSLGSAEEAWAKNLIKYADSKYSNDSGEACIERMVKTYEVCVSKHGKTAFMSDLVPVGSAETYPVNNSISQDESVILIIIVTLLSVSSLGACIYVKSRKKRYLNGRH